ncbi:hypothetical protein [Sphingobacterium pedocola]|uniref:Uncharacterized protein n=1 Tax=Sphingobacterium pedocola TaxID=2082722 RepID=A0ABR9T9Y5_9SPHI|nr:hypothetical protein [Sphingobacterium pedocola]MBE8722160.1 hypothetical protein [Sphingobacterium pedocola]
MRTQKYIIQTITIGLLLLWTPESIDKLINFHSFKYVILHQPLSYTMAWAAIWYHDDIHTRHR